MRASIILTDTAVVSISEPYNFNRHLTGKALDEKFHKDTCANFRVGNFFDEAEAIVEVEMINRNRIYTDNAVIYGTVQHLLHCFKTKEKDLEEEKMKAGIHLQPSKIRRFWRDFLKRTFLDLYKAEEDESAEDSNPVLIFPNLDAFTNLEVFTQAASHLGKLLSSLLFHGRTYLIYIPADQLERTINLFSSDGNKFVNLLFYNLNFILRTDIASQIYDIIYETKKSRTKYENRKKAGKIVSKKNRVALLTADLPSSDLPSLPVVDLLAYANEHHQEDTSESFSAMDEVENMSLNMMMNYSNNQQSSVPSMPPVPLERNWPSIPIFDEAQQQSSSQTLDLACKELMKNFEWKDFNKENNNTSGKASKKVVKSNNKNKTLESSSSRTNDGEAAKRTRISDRDRKRTSIYSPGKNEMDPTGKS